MKKIIFTVDVEANYGFESIDTLIYGKTKRGYYGLDYICHEFNKNGIKGLFFVDFAEANVYGCSVFDKICKSIIDENQDIGVHIHANSFGEQTGLMHMCQNDLQFEMIDYCTNLYRTILGHNPSSFRAGGYGANNVTLDYLAEESYKYDFSQFYGRKTCKIIPPVSVYSPCHLSNGLVEIPVTVFKGLKYGKKQRIKKIDFEMPFGEFKQVVNKIIKSNSDYDTIVFFIHSFSLVNWVKKPLCPKYSSGKVKKFKKMLSWLGSKKKELAFISEHDLENMRFEQPRSIEKQLNNLIHLNFFATLFYHLIDAAKYFKDQFFNFKQKR